MLKKFEKRRITFSSPITLLGKKFKADISLLLSMELKVEF